MYLYDSRNIETFLINAFLNYAMNQIMKLSCDNYYIVDLIENQDYGCLMKEMVTLSCLFRRLRHRIDVWLVDRMKFPHVLEH